MASITFRKVGRLMSELGFRRGSGRAFRDFTYHNQNNPQVRHTVRFPPGKNRFTKEEIRRLLANNLELSVLMHENFAKKGIAVLKLS